MHSEIFRKLVFTAQQSKLAEAAYAGFVVVTQEANGHAVWLEGGQGARLNEFHTHHDSREAALEAAVWLVSSYEDDLPGALKDIEGDLPEEEEA